ncbi:MAG: hypothetical protein ACR2P7_08105, partial [bacterium]
MRQAEGLLVVGANGVARACSHHPARVQIAIRGDWIPRIPAGMTAKEARLRSHDNSRNGFPQQSP